MGRFFCGWCEITSIIVSWPYAKTLAKGLYSLPDGDDDGDDDDYDDIIEYKYINVT